MNSSWLSGLVREALPSLPVMESLDGERIVASAGNFRLTGEQMVGGAQFAIKGCGAVDIATLTVIHPDPEERRAQAINGLRKLADIVISNSEAALDGFRWPKPTEEVKP